MIQIVLLEPEIPGNTGNIARLCAATGASLHLIEPLGFSIDDKHLKRAGLDYWHLLDIHVHKNFSDAQKFLGDRRMFFLSTKAPRNYSEVEFSIDDAIVFGKETAGIDEKILKSNWESTIRIPMISDARSLNLSNAVAIVSYEILRQNQFPNLKTIGDGLRK